MDQNCPPSLTAGLPLPSDILATPDCLEIHEYGSHLELLFADAQQRDLVLRWFMVDSPEADYYRRRGWTPPPPIGFCTPLGPHSDLQFTLPRGFEHRLEGEAHKAGIHIAWRRHLKASTVPVDFANHLLNYDSENLDRIILDPIQEDACRALLSSDLCALELTPAGGKTEVALNAWACLRQAGEVRNALFVVPTKNLRVQTFARIHKRSPWPEKVGQIGSGRFDPNANIVVATVQSACGDDRLRHGFKIQEYLKTVDLLIIDEAHHATSDQYRRLLDLCPARWVWGLSGKMEFQSVKHAAKQMALEGLFGRPYKLRRSEARTCPVTVAFYTNKSWKDKVDLTGIPSKATDNTPCHFQRRVGGPWESGIWRGPNADGLVPDICKKPDPQDIDEYESDGSPVYHRSALVRDADSSDGFSYNPSRMIPDESKYGPYLRVGSNWEQVVSPVSVLRLDRHLVAQVGFSPRNEWALELAKAFAARKEPFLVTVQRRHHLRILYNMFKGAGLKVKTCHGEQDDMKRTKSLEALRNGKIDGIIAVYTTVSEGTDIPSLVHLIKLDGITEEQVLTQQLGRVQRRSEGKKKGYMHIPVDLQASSLERHATTMRHYYAGQEIEIHDSIL